MSLQDDALNQIIKEQGEQGVVVDISDPKNADTVKLLAKMLKENRIMVTSIQSVPSLSSEGWVPLLQHGSFMVGIQLESNKTKIKVAMDSMGKFGVWVEREGIEIGKLEIDPEPEADAEV